MESESTKFCPQKCKQYINKMFDEQVVHQLSEFIKIPNLSRDFDPQYATNGLLEKAAGHIKRYIESLQIKGLKSQIIKHQGYTPILFTQIEGDIKDKTILFYGHYDKQPPMNGWHQGKGPNIPVYENGKLYGRGGADDGYSTYSSMLAIKAVQLQGLPTPRCVMITQGDEETGGHIDYYIQNLKQKIGNPSVIFCLDSGVYDYERLWMTNSLRGCVNCLMTVKNLKEGVHSGDSSGVVPNVFRIATLITQKIQNLQTGKVIKDFEVDIPPVRYQEAVQLAEIVGKNQVRDFPTIQGMQLVSNNTLDLVLNRAWRPQLTITGISNFPQVNRAGNVMIPQLSMRLSLRLPPTMDPHKAEERLKEILSSNPPYGAKVQLSKFAAGPGWNAPEMSPWLNEALGEASEIYFQNKKGCLGQGGSIPLMGLLSQIWPKAQFIITGVLGPEANAHGPNQFLHVPYCKKLTQCMAHVLAKASQQK